MRLFVLLGLVLGGCNAIFGVDGLTADELEAEGAGGAATTTTSGGGEAATGGSSFCTPGEERPCYEGPPETEGVGLCQAGIERCAGDGSGFGPCEGAVEPAEESCETPEDESCDGYGACGEVLWAHVYGGNNDDSAHALVVDASGRSTVGSHTSGTFALDGTLYSSGTADAYLHHLSPDGSVTGDLHLTGSSDEIIGGMALGDGALYVAGHYRTQLNVAGEIFGSTSGYDMFIARLDATTPSPEAVWVQTFGGSGDQRLNAVARDDQGITVVGSATGVTDLGGGPRDAGEGQICVVARYDHGGRHLWDVVSSASNACALESVTTLADGTIVVGGTYSAPLSIAGVSMPGTFFGQNGMVLSFSPSGSLIGHRGLAGNNITIGALVGDGASVWVGGGFQGNVDFGDGNVGSSGIDAFVARYVADLSTLELQLSAPDSGESRTRGLALAPNGDVLVIGHYVNGLTLAGAALDGVNNAEAFVMRLAPDGALRWAQRFGGAKHQIGERIAALPDGTFVAVGRFEDEITLDQAYVLFGGWNAWIARLSP